MDIISYTKNRKREWNEFLYNSKNGLFLFDRDYMEYHSDRFVDFSLMFYEDNKLIALLPANIEKNILVSHGGLTFGSFITNSKMTVSRMLRIFYKLLDYLKKNSINKMIYKCIPYIYQSIPSDEDSYALFRMGAKLFRRDISSVIYLSKRDKYRKLRYRCIKKAMSANLKVKKTDDFKIYWNILKENLIKKYNTKPVHTLKEIEYLHCKFPDNIKIFASYQDDTMLAGIVIYESENVAHAQYIANTKEGKEIGALDIIVTFLVNEYYQNKKYFDFGISTEDNGLYLNEGLILFKEGFGARGVVYDFYEVDIK